MGGAAHRLRRIFYPNFVRPRQFHFGHHRDDDLHRRQHCHFLSFRRVALFEGPGRDVHTAIVSGPDRIPISVLKKRRWGQKQQYWGTVALRTVVTVGFLSQQGHHFLCFLSFRSVPRGQSIILRGVEAGSKVYGRLQRHEQRHRAACWVPRPTHLQQPRAPHRPSTTLLTITIHARAAAVTATAADICDCHG